MPIHHSSPEALSLVPEFRRILVPVDGSAASLLALAWARRFSGATLTLLKVSIDFVDALPDLVAFDTNALHDEVLAELDTIAGPLRDDGLSVETLVESGDAAERIVAIAERDQSDLIVMSTHGRGAAGRVLFGSVADRVSRHAPVPTLLVRIGLDPEAIEPRRILVALDGSPLAESALPIAQALAIQLAVPVTLTRVVTLEESLKDASRIQGRLRGRAVDTTDEVLAMARERTEKQAQSYLDDRAGRFAQPVSTLLLHGSPAVSLLQEIRPSDLVIITSHGTSGVGRWLIGSVAEKLVREAAAPVVLVPAGNSAQESRSTEDR